MKAAVYSKFKEPLEIIEVNDPTPMEHGVILEVKSTGLCLSDWHGWMGHDPDISLPHIPGHEMSGIIKEVGSKVTSWIPGDRVTLPFVCGCGQCIYCREGNSQVCDLQFQPGFTHWGSFAPYVSIHFAEHNLVKIPSELSFSSASILGCRFATAFRAVVDQANIQPEQWLVVHGCGGVGLSAVMIGKAYDARIIAVDLNSAQLELAQELGAEFIIDASGAAVVDQVMDITHHGAHISIDAVGHPDLIRNSVLCLRKGGKHIQIGLLNPESKNLNLPMDRIVARELQVLGSHGMQAHRYQSMIELIINGKMNPDRLIKKSISLQESLTELVSLDQKQDPGIMVINDFN